MKKILSVGFATIGSLILIFAIVFTSMEFIINDETFINNEFTKLGVSSKMGMSNNDLVRSTVRLIDYMQGDVDNIDIEVAVNGEKTQMFALEQEVTHMRDVREIYLAIKGYRDVGALVMLVLFLFAAVIHFRKAPQMLAQGYLSGSFIALLFFGFLGTWAAMDFSNFWTFFHQMLFWNDLWLFDASESRMINMLPEQMFSDIVGQIFLYAGLAFAVLIGLSIFCLAVSSDAYKRRQAEARKRKKARQAALEAHKKARAQAKAEAEKAKRIAAKKARKEAAKKQRARQEASAARKRAKARRGADKGDTRTQARTVTADGGASKERNPDAPFDDGTGVNLAEGVTQALSEGYASDFFQSATYAEYAAGQLHTTAGTTTTTTGGLYPEAPNADFFKSYAAARGVTQRPSENALPEQPIFPGGRNTQPGGVYDGGMDADGYREVYYDEAVAAGSPRAAAQTGRKGAVKKASAGKAVSKKPSVKKPGKRGNVQDNTGFMDD